MVVGVSVQATYREMEGLAAGKCTQMRCGCKCKGVRAQMTLQQVQVYGWV